MRCILPWASCLIAISAADLSAGEVANALIATGRELFEREWKPGEAGSPGGDGLGPSFNDVSCAGCHLQGGVGGGGPIDKNVDLISMPDQPRSMSVSQAKRLFRLHPGFFSENMQPQATFVLHRFNLSPDYALQRAKFLGERNQIQPHPVVREQMERYTAARPVPAIAAGGLRFHKSQRNTPALFGLGLLDQIPDAFLHELARRQPAQQPGITGRVAPTSKGAGRFGWRGQTARLHEFVLDACGNEIGLRVPGHEQALTPNAPSYQPAGFDMSPAQCAAMIAFVAALPRPKQLLPQDPSQRKVVAAGQALFAKIGCAACHVESLGPVQAVYTDLLLHDMGPALRDPAAANPTVLIKLEAGVAIDGQADTGGDDEEEPTQPKPHQPRHRTFSHRPPSSSYAGGGFSPAGSSQTARAGNMIIKKTELPVPTNLQQEWQTPALWGVQDSAPYLHDGRAQTLVEAVAWHGGEAKAAAERFFALPAEQQFAILDFLRTLRAPGTGG